MPDHSHIVPPELKQNLARSLSQPSPLAERLQRIEASVAEDQKTPIEGQEILPLASDKAPTVLKVAKALAQDSAYLSLEHNYHEALAREQSPLDDNVSQAERAQHDYINQKAAIAGISDIDSAFVIRALNGSYPPSVPATAPSKTPIAIAR